MFVVTKEDIKKLRDDDLRTLIGLLCEATLSSFKISTKSITYGGNQDSSDGGVDVRIRMSSNISLQDEYIPANRTVFQVKVPDLQPAMIIREMRLKGKLRESIIELASDNGAYIIISSKAELTDSQLKKRIQVMKETAGEYSENLVFDFYDNTRLASWINMYPPLCAWVKNKTGIAFTGWRTYEEWRKGSKELNNDFLISEKSYLYSEQYKEENKIDMKTGIKKIREDLNQIGKVVRIAGLSGVGKTRLAFALFDKSLDEVNLDSNLLLYCDIGNQPNPTPMSLIEYLINLRKRVIIIVDNCEKELHTRLAKICNTEESKVSLLTIEYDAKEDDVLDTANYYMVSSDDGLIERYLKENYDNLELPHIETIVQNSGGNFRLATYFAKTFDKNESIGVLRSDELFDRLFYSNNELNINLLKTAEVCSLVYSFNIESELQFFSKISGLSCSELYENIQELTKMQLVQSRGEMRAVLPHGLANKLAIDFLIKHNRKDILDIIDDYPRIFLSLSRRIKYLHTYKEAIQFAISIHDKYFTNYEVVKSEMVKVLSNLKYLIPDKIVERLLEIENLSFFSRKNKNYNDYVYMIIFILYDIEYFDDCILLLFRFSLSEGKIETHNSVKRQIETIYQLYLSGTHATIEQRLNSIRYLFDMKNNAAEELAFCLLDKLLQTDGFSGFAIEDFGTMKRDYGYFPKTHEAIRKWYTATLDLIFSYLFDDHYNQNCKITLANNYPSLLKRGLYNYLKPQIHKLVEKESFPELWLSINHLFYFDKEDLPDQIKTELLDLAKIVKPINLVEKFKIYLYSDNKLRLDIDLIEDDHDNLRETIIHLGEEFSNSLNILQENINLLLGGRSYYMVEFGIGLMSKEVSQKVILELIIRHVNEKNNSNHGISLLLKGMFTALRENEDNYQECIQMVCNDATTVSFYPILQSVKEINDVDFDRLINLVEARVIEKSKFLNLTYKIVDMSDEKIICYLNTFDESNESIELKVDVIEHYLSKKKLSDELISLSALSILNYDFFNKTSSNSRIEHEFGEVAKNVFIDDRFSKEVSRFFINFKFEMAKNYISFNDIKGVFIPLLQFYYKEFLDLFIVNEENGIRSPHNWFLYNSFWGSPLTYIPDEKKLEWIKNKDIKTLVEFVDFCEPFMVDEDTKTHKWTDLGNYIINVVNDTKNNKLLKVLCKTIYPFNEDQSLPILLGNRIDLLLDLYDKVLNDLKDDVNIEILKLKKKIKTETKEIERQRRIENETFE
ncbi:hypothetical protein [Breznakia pachnodae]|uniref:ATP-binding protein n=1 Tax=Breznakia pachnodae TaxID=265178 RepID=A0ABU0DXU9_9FIRM|nr:hypothetical protein [Breznakia pachnodae]MDQ0359452.1 hypothetical protein [Breznakia pachnodae]